MMLDRLEVSDGVIGPVGFGEIFSGGGDDFEGGLSPVESDDVFPALHSLTLGRNRKVFFFLKLSMVVALDVAIILGKNSLV